MDAVATAKLALDASGMDRGLASAQTSLERFAKTATATIAGGFAFNKIISGFSSAIEKGDQLQDIAEKFGVSASKLQLLGNAASVFGSNVEQVSAGLNKLSLAQQKAISGESGSESLVAAFNEVGISMEELRSMSAEDIFLAISDSFASGANEGRQFVIVNELLGKAQTDLIKVLNQGSEAIIEQGNAIGVFSDETIASLSEASDAIKTLQNKFTIGFGLMAQGIMPVIRTIEMLSEQLGFAIAAAEQLLRGDLKAANAVAAAGGKARKEFGKEEVRPKPDKSRGIDSDVVESKSIKEVEKAEKEAIKERTDEAMRILDNENFEKELANKSYERKRDRERERMLEAANSEVQAAQEKMKQEREQAAKQKDMAAGPGGTSRQFELARGGAATEALNFAAGLGDRGISQAVGAERGKAGREQQKANRKEFDEKVLSQTSATTAEGLTRTMTSRRQEFIKKEAGKEAKGGKSLSDIYQVLNDALSKITAAPIVT